ncbi:MAG: bifunctional phosphopantothenoylcysteine decarboxylase/phosphopantothenate--cysteine ligase CoaBC [Gammaproteobacteria bacterium]|nr:bifunctional phosphopantothenoylcysteine decarboxylase/phosphopantothenate--cysteine ligase CoaBC [Gammaproteobacteria bacterium]
MQNKNIILGITGGIAAYKSAELTRLLRHADCNVRVIMTQNAQEFITPLTLQTLSGNQVYTKMFAQDLELNIKHIALARSADLVVIAPASANFIAKLAYGLADDLLSTVCLATTAPIAIAPAMNKIMWQNTITQKNIASLQDRGINIWGPAAGDLACNEIGLGRMLEATEIFSLIKNFFTSKILQGVNILITAGPTQEALDPVRFLTNKSSGKMGYAIARAAEQAGANVTLISGPTSLLNPPNVKRIGVISAEEMYSQVIKQIKNTAIFISTAAVADYRPAKTAKQKIKKTGEELTLELQKTPDILAAVARLPKKPFTIGFAAETENVKKNAIKKLQTKNLDMIVANKVGKNLGFESDNNELLILSKNAPEIKLSYAAKTQLAKEFITIVANKIKHKG